MRFLSIQQLNSLLYLKEIFETVDLEHLKKLNEHEAVAYVYNQFFELRQCKDYNSCNEVLERIDVQGYHPAILLSVLTILCPIKSQLPEWEGFLTRTKTHLEASLGAERAKRCLVGFI